MKKAIATAIIGSILSFSAAAGKFDIEPVAQQDINWRFQDLHILEKTDTTVISGRLSANSRFGLAGGHVDVIAFSPSGDKISQTVSGHVAGNLTRRMQRRGGVRFKATFTDEVPVGSVIKLAFHRDPSVIDVSLHQPMAISR